MKKILYLFTLLSPLVFLSCTKTDGVDGPGDSALGAFANNGGGVSDSSGKITAGEWNDLDHWGFWDSLLKKPDFSSHSSYWGFFTSRRISVHIANATGMPVCNYPVQLKRAGAVEYAARTDNFGKAELWVDLFRENQVYPLSNYQLDVNNGEKIITTPKIFSEGVNEVVVTGGNAVAPRVEVCFVVDATGSMGDELSFLQTELKNVVDRVYSENPGMSVYTSSVFYRDEGDEYVTRVSGFTSNSATTINFIKNQKADGGGDGPEAVHSALDNAINDLQWSADAKTRILFLVLDAPPHYTTNILDKLHALLSLAAEKGIKVIPITASGILKGTEFLMRFFSIASNGTYVFITNHSGIGNDHIEASVGPYQVEYLNNLMVRLVSKYAH